MTGLGYNINCVVSVGNDVFYEEVSGHNSNAP